MRMQFVEEITRGAHGTKYVGAQEDSRAGGHYQFPLRAEAEQLILFSRGSTES